MLEFLKNYLALILIPGLISSYGLSCLILINLDFILLEEVPVKGGLIEIIIILRSTELSLAMIQKAK
jgi:hypothetical protein